MKAKKFLVLLFAFGCILAIGQNASMQNHLAQSDRLFFIENKGQWHPDVLYLCRMGGLDAWVTKYGMNYTFYKVESRRENSPFRIHSNKLLRKHKPENEIIGHRVLLELKNYNPNSLREGKQQQYEYYNYFIGNDETKHATYVGLYKEALVKNVYNGIDLRYYFDNGKLRYDFVVHPYADVSQIQFTLRGQDRAYVKNGNQLCFTTRFGEVALADLHTYQGDRTIESRFVQNGDTWQIALGSYDKSKTLIIDPLVYSTYIGGSQSEYCFNMVLDNSGNAYLTGSTDSPNYDVTPGAFQTINAGGQDVFVTKLNSTGTALVFSTYIGGSNNDYARDIFVDNGGNVYVVGGTSSADYDITGSTFQTTLDGYTDAFVTKLNPTGTALLYSTYLGGGDYEDATGIAVDNAGNVYITGHTASTNYDISPGAFQTTNGGEIDVFVTKLNNLGNSLLYSTYIGGDSAEVFPDIAIDASGNAYITGWTGSPNFDVTSGAFQTSIGGEFDGFVTKINPTGTALVFSTFIGGSSEDIPQRILVDNSGNVYIAGYTLSSNYDVTSGVFQNTSGGSYDVFVTKFNPSGATLAFSTYLGGAGDDGAFALALDAAGNVIIAGITNSTDYDITSGAYQSTKKDAEDAFVSKLNSNGTVLMYSSYLGGDSTDFAYGVAVDGSHVYLAGSTNSTNYPTTTGAFQTTNAGWDDIFVTKMNISSTYINSTSLNPREYFDLYPNPVEYTLFIENFTNTSQEYEITDVSGKVLAVYVLPQGKNSISINLPKGNYWIRERKHNVTQSFVVN
ncbi:MAG: SBBP repeat-containing protein [Bacteroidia bacterium]|nr:SBBP repeat-containing protein [Bacteroidia bacterium]